MQQRKLNGFYIAPPHNFTTFTSIHKYLTVRLFIIYLWLTAFVNHSVPNSYLLAREVNLPIFPLAGRRPEQFKLARIKFNYQQAHSNKPMRPAATQASCLAIERVLFAIFPVTPFSISHLAIYLSVNM